MRSNIEAEHTVEEQSLPWNWVPLLVYLTVNGVALCFLGREMHGVVALASPFPMLVFGLATYRIANVVSNERITKVVRAPFVDTRLDGDKVVEEPKPQGLRSTVGQLLYCPSCTGIWIATALAYGFVFAHNVAWFVAIIFALSSVERILTSSLEAMTQRER